jgi:hypothetical protein
MIHFWIIKAESEKYYLLYVGNNTSDITTSLLKNSWEEEKSVWDEA